MKMNPAALGAVLMLFSGTVNANAGLATYADFSFWSAAVPGYASVAILDPTGSEGYDDFGSGTASVSYGGVLFATNAALGNGSFYNIGPTFSGSNGFFPVLSSQQQSDGVANILITLAAPVKAFALNFDTFFGSDVTFTLSNGETLTLTSAGNAYDLGSFFGVTDDNPFKTVLLTSSDPVLNLNALNFGTAVSAIPEPATWVMLLLGFVGIGLFGARLPARRAPTLLIDKAQS
ncbi:PEP-CTERM sorting domain-containing protein [Bradyrhizobium sp. 170]|uniref:PEP-CTERM sorting domain-containing protein n=1 Tax=Bradyrhizobium sp. 170 TaxID=2782641 RepID=UPI001FFFF8AE|nr:PEP-CTERM sorting domain-containing protein [Bradyrhizobium sp. 170]UPK02362.1 PEP-CTERM sorting domain-containing protein [Bradyrhizobium sp. 170]